LLLLFFLLFYCMMHFLLCGFECNSIVALSPLEVQYALWLTNSSTETNFGWFLVFWQQIQLTLH